MDTTQDLPQPIRQIQQTLKPYTKSRQDAARVRQILATHLSSVQLQGDGILSHPLSLVTTAELNESSPTGVRGIRREYTRCFRANVKARNEYDNVKSQHRAYADGEGSVRQLNRHEDLSEAPLDSFLEVTRYRRRHERLRIIQNYVERLSQKPAAAASYLNTASVLKDVESLPRIPPEVMGSSVPQNGPETVDLNDLVDRLEKSVLRARLVLKREQTFLEKVRAENAKVSRAQVNQKGQLQALGMARNELINWIETELAKAGESSTDSVEEQEIVSTELEGKRYIEGHLDMIQRQYSQYLKTRQSLVLAINGKLEHPAATVNDPAIEPLVSANDSASSTGANQTLYPYLEGLVSISNEQKFIIQQKAHLTISLAKQLKEANQGIDRLAEESHLLPAHPMPLDTSQRRGKSSFDEDISSHEKPNSSRRARAWVFASNKATVVTRDATIENVEDGMKFTVDAERNLSELQFIFGEEMDKSKEAELEIASDSNSKTASSKDIWSQLDGQLGVIKSDQ